MVCTFFGHRDTPCNVETALVRVLKDLIEKKGVNDFYVGNNGNFDRLVLNTLRALKNEYPHISYSVVLSCLTKDNEYDVDETIIFDDFESVPGKFAISKRNDWMIKQSDVVVAYVVYSFGGAYQFVKKAELKGKEIINLYCKNNKIH